jgi:hypothetical protein
VALGVIENGKREIGNEARLEMRSIGLGIGEGCETRRTPLAADLDLGGKHGLAMVHKGDGDRRPIGPGREVCAGDDPQAGITGIHEQRAVQSQA